jgi:hypothetical protein
MLALEQATKYFRCYLHEKEFLARTDHAALSFFHKFADNSSRLMRWSLRLADFDFTVEHTPGSKIAHVDALSRHVGMAEEPPTIDKLTVLKEQEKDPFCEKQKRTRFSDKSEFFLDAEGVLYRRQLGRQHQLVVPQTLVNQVIAMNHVPSLQVTRDAKELTNLLHLAIGGQKCVRQQTNM